MRHSICCIDDKIPASQFPMYFDDTQLLEEQVLNFLVKCKETKWEDSSLKALFEQLLEDEEWSVTAFTAPSFFERYSSETVFSPDVVVFDWDYNAVPGSDDSSDALLAILHSSYSIVFILSGSDNIEEISTVISTPEFKRYENRLQVVAKENEVSAETILNSYKQREASLFTYKYGCEIVRRSNKAINCILSDISRLSAPGFISAIGDIDNQDYYASNDVIIDAMIPRFRKALSSTDLDGFRVKQEEGSGLEIEKIKEIWRYRLYDDTHYDRVAMGDIVHNEKDDKYYVVFSSDCHMNDFWKKNGGYITLIPLLQASEQETKDLIMTTTKKINISSLANSPHPFMILPAVPVGGDSVDFVAFPKGILSMYIRKQKDGQENILKYKYWPHFKRIASLLDPFKSPFIQLMLDKITGYGCPDFPAEMKDYISKIVKLP